MLPCLTKRRFTSRNPIVETETHVYLHHKWCFLPCYLTLFQAFLPKQLFPHCLSCVKCDSVSRVLIFSIVHFVQWSDNKFSSLDHITAASKGWFGSYRILVWLWWLIIGLMFVDLLFCSQFCSPYGLWIEVSQVLLVIYFRGEFALFIYEYWIYIPNLFSNPKIYDFHPLSWL